MNDSGNEGFGQDQCAKCKKRDPKLLCTGCSLYRYCSKECQKADWKTHKEVCRLCKRLAVTSHENLEDKTKILEDSNALVRQMPFIDNAKRICLEDNEKSAIRIVQNEHGSMTKSHVYLKSALQMGEILMLEPHDDMVITSYSVTAETIDWSHFLDPALTPEEQDSYWESFVSSSRTKRNFTYTARSGTIIALCDIPAGGELFCQANETILSLQLLNIQEQIIGIKTMAIPEQVLVHRDPEQKNRYWSKLVEPKVLEYLIDPDTYIIIGVDLQHEGCYSFSKWNDFISDGKFFTVKPPIVKHWEDTLSRLLHKNLEREAVTNQERLDRFKAQAHFEAILLHFELHRNPYKFPIRK